MISDLLIYGANGFVGEAVARMAVEGGLRPVLAGRNASKLEPLAAELGVECRVFDLSDPQKVENALKGIPLVLHCAGPFLYTYQPMVAACLKTGTHYLDLTGEVPVYEAIAKQDADARKRGVMLMPGVGFDVVPTDCLALHLKERLPSATRLAIAFRLEGPAGLPPGTQRTIIEMAVNDDMVRSNGHLVYAETGANLRGAKKRGVKTRTVDFGKGPVLATRLTWGDIFTAYYSTGIPNIEDYTVFTEATRMQMAALRLLRPLLKMKVVRNLLKLTVKPGPTAEEIAQTTTHIWGEVEDDQGRRAVARIHGPEAGVIFTGRAALAVVRKVLAGDIHPGYQTPATAFGADFVLECEGVTREDVE
jgi:short subunit dehydrogenase-like uncharacterized protein